MSETIVLDDYSGPRSRTGAKIAVVLHQATSSPGRVGQLLQGAGFALDIYRPPLGQRLPEDLSPYSGVVVFGGPMSANDDHESYIRAELVWIERVLAAQKPFMGICLGAQLLARCSGGCVGRQADGEVEIGWYPLEVTKEGEGLLPWPKMVYHFHNEGIYDLPKEAQILARSRTYPVQAFRYNGHAWGVQFHPELTRSMMQRLVVCGAHEFQGKGAQPGRTHLAGRFLYDHALRYWLEQALRSIFSTPYGVETDSLGLARTHLA
ncbi:glutamine amidotransferase [Bartonella sp. DGB2]|uniref:glutamine amidotransferase n=1 Tax=Bartonella sp. DGB2 TaxID=3388426 RepID=UPI00398FD8A6